jgi:hypothetical protein
MRRMILLAVIAVLAVMVFVPVTASADGVYHSEHIALTPVGNQPLRTGFVENIHANGPVVFAMERYVLNGASPGTTYQVALNIWVGNPACTGTPTAVLETASFTTNVSGNGVGHARFSPSDAEGLHGLTIGVIWTLSIGTTVAYHTACTDVILD